MDEVGLKEDEEGLGQELFLRFGLECRKLCLDEKVAAL